MIWLLFNRVLMAVLVVGAALTAPAALIAGGTACDRIRQRIGELRIQVNEVDRQLQALEASLFTGRKLNVEEIARQRNEEQRLRQRRADLLGAIPGLEQRIRDIDRLLQVVRAETDRLVVDINAFKADRLQHETDVAAHNADAEAQNRAVSYFNSLSAHQQSQAEAERLNRWGATVNARRDRINGRVPQLQSLQQELIRREQALLNKLSELNRLENGY